VQNFTAHMPLQAFSTNHSIMCFSGVNLLYFHRPEHMNDIGFELNCYMAEFDLAVLSARTIV